MQTRASLVLTTFLLAAGCATEPVQLTDPDPALLSKGGGKGGGGGGGGTTNPNAIFTYHHQVGDRVAGIIGDSRKADGSTNSDGTSVYDHGKCGVSSTIWTDRAGDATMDPVGGKNSKTNCTTSVARSLTVLFNGHLDGAELTPAGGGHFTNVRAVLDLGVGASDERQFTLLLRGGHTCERIRYDANVTAFNIQGSAVRVERTSLTEWTAESVPNAAGQHVAFCQVGGTGGVGDFYNPGTQLGAYDMPLRITIQQK